MPKIFITGNGFDLSLGLPTAYNDFIRVMSYVKSAQLTDINFQTVFSKLENHEKFFEQFEAFELDTTEIEKIKPLLKKNLWFKYFEDKLNFQTWIDFEGEIEHVLKKILCFLELFTKEEISHFSRVSEEKVFNRLIPKNREEFSIVQSFQLINKNRGELSFNRIYCNYLQDSFIGFNSNYFFEVLHQQLYEFNRILNHYFIVIVEPIIKLNSFKDEAKLFSKIDFHFTFNYTSTFDKITSKKGFSKHLHGKSNSIEKLLVLGISELTGQIETNKSILPFIKYFQKLHFDTDYMFLSTLDTSKDQNFEFYLYGHSLNESDKDYINEIFDFNQSINEYSTVQIVVFYHNEESRFSFLKNLLHLREKKEIESMMKEKSLRFIECNSEEMKSVLSKDCSPTKPRYSIGGI